MRNDGERVILDADEARPMLNIQDGTVHTFAVGGSALVGMDHSAAFIEKLLTEAVCIELSGEVATRMGHGLFVKQADGRALFLATREGAVPGFDPVAIGC